MKYSLSLYRLHIQRYENKTWQPDIVIGEICHFVAPVFLMES